VPSNHDPKRDPRHNRWLYGPPPPSLRGSQTQPLSPAAYCFHLRKLRKIANRPRISLLLEIISWLSEAKSEENLFISQWGSVYRRWSQWGRTSSDDSQSSENGKVQICAFREPEGDGLRLKMYKREGNNCRSQVWLSN
jgi:hypothetical protein